MQPSKDELDAYYSALLHAEVTTNNVRLRDYYFDAQTRVRNEAGDLLTHPFGFAPKRIGDYLRSFMILLAGGTGLAALLIVWQLGMWISPEEESLAPFCVIMLRVMCFSIVEYVWLPIFLPDEKSSSGNRWLWWIFMLYLLPLCFTVPMMSFPLNPMEAGIILSLLFMVIVHLWVLSELFYGKIYTRERKNRKSGLPQRKVIAITPDDYAPLLQSIDIECINDRTTDYKYWVAKNEIYGLLAAGVTLEDVKEELIELLDMMIDVYLIQNETRISTRLKAILSNLKPIVDPTKRTGDHWINEDLTSVYMP